MTGHHSASVKRNAQGVNGFASEVNAILMTAAGAKHVARYVAADVKDQSAITNYIYIIYMISISKPLMIPTSSLWYPGRLSLD